MSKGKKIGLGILIGVAIAAIVGSVGFFAWTRANFYPAQAQATALVAPTPVANRAWRVFAPDRPTGQGFIIYPGGLVDPDAYAPLAHRFAERGIFTVIVPMPLNLAVLSPNRADQVIRTFTGIDSWVIGGHSLGGAMSGEFISRNPGDVPAPITGLALWAARLGGGSDVSALPLEAVSIYGTLDGIQPDNLTDADRLVGLPPDATLVPIEGGNHSMFGDYGLQSGDNPATISQEAAWDQIVAATMPLFD